MSQSPAWLRIVQFIRDSLDWPLEAIADATSISSSTLSNWSRGDVVPSVTAWTRFLQWALSLGAVRNHSADGSPWAWQPARACDCVLSYRHQIFLLTSFEKWLVIYFYDGDLVEVDETEKMFSGEAADQRTNDFIAGTFG